MRLLLVFTRYPVPGATKTRLVPCLGPEGAADLHRAMAEHTLRRVVGAADRVEVRYEGGDEGQMRAWLGAGARLRPQGGGDLGARLSRAFEEGFAGGADAVAAIGTDCPGLDAGDVDAAFAALRETDAVFGPAADGGYWLVGVRRGAWGRAGEALFAGIPWGGPGVLAASRDAATDAGLVSALLRVLEDVDRPEDLATWERERGAGPGG